MAIAGPKANKHAARNRFKTFIAFPSKLPPSFLPCRPADFYMISLLSSRPHSFLAFIGDGQVSIALHIVLAIAAEHIIELVALAARPYIGGVNLAASMSAIAFWQRSLRHAGPTARQAEL
ncbi:hypothetical protein [Sinorhizobium sp. BJ1]|uniref:hypothetical protein n=1 Tax=Sinorhizobium sp. BJ1 TaxID=2035455 RepID=UPI0015CF6C08|nr:hypothetical protein [Sinorhizobium sp. BJ1]